MSTRRTLKHWFVPHHHNNHHPHAIRSHGLALFAVAILLLQVVWNLSVGSGAHVLGYSTDISPDNLLAQTNQQRTSVGLPPLHLSGDLAEGATAKAHDMIARNYWAHVAPDGTQPWQWFTKAGYNYAYAGENLAKDFSTTSGVISGWMNSPEHRANMLGNHYSDVGFAVVNGSLQGRPTTLVVAFYGSVAGAALPATSTANPSALVTLAPVAQVSYSLFRPLAVTRTLGWASLITVLLLGVLFVIFAATHLAVWRKNLLRWQKRHYRIWAALELGTIALAMIIIISTSFGSVH